MATSSTPIVAVSKSGKLQRDNLPNQSLPTEIITDIFSRLPVKSVFQMECLSKHYSSSLSKDPHFVEAHFRQSSRLRPSLIVKKQYGVSLIRSDGDKITVEKVTLPPEIDYPDSHENFDIVASCNGLVLVVIGPRCSLWNPATVTFLNLPYRPYSNRGPNDEKLHFRKASWGFGYCNQSHDYKIIRFAKHKHKDQYPYSNVIKKFFAEVICVDTNRVWRSVDFSGFEMCKGSGISLNGVAYWQPTRHEGNYRILTSDLAKEKFAWISCPEYGQIMVFKGSLAIGFRISCPEYGQIMVFKGSLAIGFRRHIQSSCTLWLLKDERAVNKDSWMIHSSLDFCPNMLVPIRFLNDHQLLLQDWWAQDVLEDVDYECFLYDFDTKEIKQIPDLSVYHFEETHYNFSESLVTLYDIEHSSENDSDNFPGGSNYYTESDD